MRLLREFYDRYPMITVRLIFFFCGIPFFCVISLLINELFGMKAYQHMYAPILAFLASAYFYFLRKATILHINKDSQWSNKRRFYSCYYGILGIASVIFLLSSICALLELL